MTVRLQIIAKRAIALGATSIPETAAPVAARPAAAAKSLHAGVLRPRPILLCISPAASFCPALAVSLVGRLPCLRGNPWLDPASGAGFRFLRDGPLPSLACCLPRPLLCAPLPRPTCPLQLPPSSLHAVASPHATTQRLQDACLLIVFLLFATDRRSRIIHPPLALRHSRQSLRAPTHALLTPRLFAEDTLAFARFPLYVSPSFRGSFPPSLSPCLPVFLPARRPRALSPALLNLPLALALSLASSRRCPPSLSLPSVSVSLPCHSCPFALLIPPLSPAVCFSLSPLSPSPCVA